MVRTPEDIQDELLVLRCQDGDGDALRSLIARWQPRLGGLASRLTGDREAARDVVQDTWLAIVRGIKRLDDPARFRSWAYRIVTNKCVDWTRRRIAQRSATRELQETAAVKCDAPSGEASVESDVGLLRVALSRLPGEQRAILSLHYLDGMRIAEIADALGIPAGTVKSRLHHARNSLRQSLERVRT